MCFHLSWLSSFGWLSYVNNLHYTRYLVKAVNCGVPNKHFLCLFVFEPHFHPSRWLGSTLFSFVQVALTLSILEIKRHSFRKLLLLLKKLSKKSLVMLYNWVLSVFSSQQFLHPIWSSLKQKFLLIWKKFSYQHIYLEKQTQRLSL